MTYTDHSREARKYSATAAAATRRAERQAREADSAYRQAAAMDRQAAWLTQRPDLCDRDYTPAMFEGRARSWVLMGNSCLRASFRATDSAVFYVELAASYRQMAKRQAERMAA
jgi:hypothetical protein